MILMIDLPSREDRFLYHPENIEDFIKDYIIDVLYEEGVENLLEKARGGKGF